MNRPRWLRFTRAQLLVASCIVVAAGLLLQRLGCERRRWPDHHARFGQNGYSAIGALRTVNTAQNQFREQDYVGEGTPRYAHDLRELRETDSGGGNINLIDAALATGTKSGYLFETVGGARTFTATACPIDDTQGRYCFYVDQSGIIRYEEGRPAGPGSARLGR